MSGESPVVVWRFAACRHPVLKVFLRPDGWHPVQSNPHKDTRFNQPAIFTDDRAKLPGWPRRFPPIVHDRGTGATLKVLPLDFDEWPRVARLTVNCQCDTIRVQPISALLADCARFKRHGKRVPRIIS